eukprot:2116388-Alexandrium_andersonii.AAC.1
MSTNLIGHAPTSASCSRDTGRHQRARDCNGLKLNCLQARVRATVASIQSLLRARSSDLQMWEGSEKDREIERARMP